MLPSSGTLLILGLAAGALLVCGPEGPRSSGSGTELEPDADVALQGSGEDTLVVLYQADERLLGPHWDVEAKFQVFQPLVTRDRQGRLASAMARRWTHSDDYRRWTFHLRRDVRWHDDVPFTAHDVRFTLELSSHPDVLYEGGGRWIGLDSVAIHDDTTFTLLYDRPTDALDTWGVYFPKHLLEDLDPENFFDWEFWTRPVGNGPYRYVRHEPKTMVELEANPDYFRGKPVVDRLILKLGGTSPLVELKSGHVDVITWVNRTDLRGVRDDDRYRIYYGLEPRVSQFRAIHWNQHHPVLSDRRVRRALTMALNRPALMAALSLPEGLPVTGGPFSVRQHRTGELPAPWPHDPDRARATLAEAGWRDEDGDGTRERRETGQSFRIELLLREGDIDEDLALLIQDAWRRVGVEAKLVPMERALLRRRLRDGAFDAVLHPIRLNPGSLLDALGGDGPTGYVDPEMTRRLRELAATVEPAVRDSLYRAVAAIFRGDLPVTLLFPVSRTHVAHRRVMGLESPYRANPLLHAEELWIEEPQ